MMKKFFKKLGLFLMLVVILSYALERFFKDRYVRFSKHYWMENIHDQSFDYVLLGSSRVLNNIDVNSVNEAYGKSGVNLGTSASNLAENYIVLHNYLEMNECKELIISMDEFRFNSVLSYSYPFHEYEFIHQLDDPVVKETFEDYVPKWKLILWNVLPLSKYIEFNDRIEYTKPDVHHLDHSKGSELETDMDFKNFVTEEQTLGLDQLDVKYFKKIMDLCQSKGIQVIFITPPIFDGMDKFKKNSSEAYEYIASQSDHYQVEHIGYLDLIDNTNDYFFRDYTHLNSEGALQYSRNLGRALRQLSD